MIVWQIGALKEVKRELALMRNALLKTLIAELEKAIYERLSPVNVQGSLHRGSTLNQSSGVAGSSTRSVSDFIMSADLAKHTLDI